VGRRAVLLIVALFVAAAGTTLVLLYVQGINARATAEQQPVMVLTATGRIESGETLAAAQAAGKVDLSEWPTAKVLPDAVSSAQGLQDRVAVTTIFPGEQIITGKLGESGDQDLISIPEGKLAISVQLSDPARVAGFVRPGSEVAIFVTGTPTLKSPNGTTRTLPDTSKVLLRTVEVIGVGQTTVLSTTTTSPTGAETTEQIPTTILTLAVTQEEAERIFVAGQGGELAFGLLNEKSRTQDTAGTTLNDIYN
jgi:pilus assembly protein CpaB